MSLSDIISIYLGRAFVLYDRKKIIDELNDIVTKSISDSTEYEVKLIKFIAN